MKRISKHMKSLGCSSIEEYLDVLKENRAEQETLLLFLRITISRFFRDRELWTSLSDSVFPLLLEQNNAFKIWCAGCSCGEEAYSLNILHQLHWATCSSIEILATDASDACLERAQKGIYQKSSLRELEPTMLSTCFQPSVRRNEFALNQTFKKGITWEHHDFFSSPPDRGFHAVFLRNNLLTYHSPRVQSIVLERILKSLLAEGFLVIGSHEIVPPQPFNLVPTACKMIYQLKESV
jgi:chemotaxis methyl-accepting protein methylase